LVILRSILGEIARDLRQSISGGSMVMTGRGTSVSNTASM
jgi:hypothetical protein